MHAVVKVEVKTNVVCVCVGGGGGGGGLFEARRYNDIHIKVSKYNFLVARTL